MTRTATGSAICRCNGAKKTVRAATAPGRKGFGTRLIDRSSRFELNGSAELKFDPDGFNAEIEFPID